MAQPKFTLIKRFTYRELPEEWSNSYWISGQSPGSAANWKVLVDAWAAQEKTVYSSQTVIVRAYCYDDGNNPSTVTIDYEALGATIPGTFNWGTLHRAPGDAAYMVKAATPRRTSRGKVIYVRKYFHECWMSPTDPDLIDNTQGTALGQYVSLISTGAGINGHHWTDAQGSQLSAPALGGHITTRTLKRRGKRPPT